MSIMYGRCHCSMHLLRRERATVRVKGALALSVEVKHIALVRRYIEGLWSGERIENPHEWFTDDFVAHEATGTHVIHGYEQFIALGEQFMEAFPAIEVKMRHIVASGENVVVHWTHRGKPRIALPGLPSTESEALLEGMALFRIAQGKMAEVWEVVQVRCLAS
ncbi:putative SnoaL-like aldol condensation-catalyzing enzyme [Thermosporothrix hazakensis]|uniref:Putative SnoaL-like aldol condensation-catalyzing enzyme n=1 Tax=Thermosporothrix hazakensis TaxID=644383 RepID=A0A326U9A9_THEHA|nr:putative SnoaL-like aldol condensation-catalyzing enzyme [Thermosporothrix hazakensis]